MFQIVVPLPTDSNNVHGYCTSPRQYKNNLSRASCTTHANPFVRLSPVMALHRTMTHLCVEMLSSSSFCRTSSSPMHPGTSVLFKNTSRLAPDNLCKQRVSLHLISAFGTHFFPQQFSELCLALADPQSVRCVNHPNQCISLLKIVAPVRSDGLLSTHIPYIELVPSLVSFHSYRPAAFSPLKVNGFDDKAQCWANRVDIFIHDAFHNSRLASIVKSTTLLAQAPCQPSSS